jgi:hypothetical protein
LRPDACGLDPETGDFAFSEAQTLKDLDTEHTRNQFRVFAQRVHRRDRTGCRLYSAVPRSTDKTLDRVLGKAGLLGASRNSATHPRLLC